ncbi:hypothetical protein M378DRAFT_164237 [Amanita muscaria Koide BX008]|uniref:Uncharacterized protein n=1 Tax=Amanita muscaria (strain Koide BX008) TaxID=946122 RepID=A0A0C2X4E9_AMAMK|nr:hypothetical protein M378DRAFT_164237 [Amanita muscaria Koide BX008]
MGSLALSTSSTHCHHPLIVPPNVAEKSKGPPAFIQKLFEVVSDTKSIDVIRWSSSFFGQSVSVCLFRSSIDRPFDVDLPACRAH